MQLRMRVSKTDIDVVMNVFVDKLSGEGGSNNEEERLLEAFASPFSPP